MGAIFISTSATTITRLQQAPRSREEGGDKDSPRMTSSSRHSTHHTGNGVLNSSTADVARPDKISGADINSICQEVNDGFSLIGAGDV